MYETLGHGEACRVTLDNGTAVSRKQMTALLKYYFEVRKRRWKVRAASRLVLNNSSAHGSSFIDQAREIPSCHMHVAHVSVSALAVYSVLHTPRRIPQRSL